MKKINDKNFYDILKNNKLVLIEWSSEYCMQCVALEPTMKKLEGKYPNIKFYSANINDVNKHATAYGIMSLPTIILFKDGENVHQFYGNLPIDVFEKELDKL